MAASAKRYGALAGQLTPAFAQRTFTLSNLGNGAVSAKGCIGRNSQATAMGLTAYALGIAANGGNCATGAAIVATMLTHPAFMVPNPSGQGLVSLFTITKANGVHISANATTAAKWCQGYVNGLCRPQHGLAK
jgi:hypothetical protein